MTTTASAILLAVETAYLAVEETVLDYGYLTYLTYQEPDIPVQVVGPVSVVIEVEGDPEGSYTSFVASDTASGERLASGTISGCGDICFA